MFQKIKQKTANHLINIPGWRTNRKIVVIESDDWGSIRMSSKQALNKLRDIGYSTDECYYSTNDALETNKDLEYLLDVLYSVRDSNGNPAIFTINNIVGNPDFQKIKKSNFEEYHYKSFVESLREYNSSDKVMSLYDEGIRKNLLKPQFHGREHVHTHNWLSALQKGEAGSLHFFEEGMFTYSRGKDSCCKKEYLDAFATYNDRQLQCMKKKLKSGLELFEQIWGYPSNTIIAPCYIWNRKIEHFFSKFGIELIQSGRCQKEPVKNQNKYNIIRRYTGQKNKYGQVYSIRNVIFEPTSDPGIDWIDKSMNEIAVSFFWQKPAVISTHRVNFAGRINPSNREENVRLLKNLLKEIVSKWPEVEFMSSDQLARNIINN